MCAVDLPAWSSGGLSLLNNLIYLELKVHEETL